MLDWGLIALNFLAGAAVFLSPCGFPMLPAYLAFYLERDVPLGQALSVSAPRNALAGGLRGLAGGLVAAAGAALVLALVAGLAAWLGTPFKRHVLLLELVGGLVVIALGILLLSGREVSFTPTFTPSKRRGFVGLFLFGAMYAGVSAGCVAPIFLGVIFEAIALPVSGAVVALGSYVLGLTTLLVGVTVAVGALGAAAIAPMWRALRYTKRAGGVLMVAVGAYLVWYWARAEFLA